MFALVDCNNFYVSCERVFRPDLEGKPVIVLSNNDGCMISRSDEAKQLGLKMAEPAFNKMKFLKENNVHIFSSNYTLYGDMSQRVMDTLRHFTSELEVYSIDEAFLNIRGISNPFSYIKTMQNTIKQNTGIPVSIGVAKTKSLAKIANKIAKSNHAYGGLFIIENEHQQDCVLRNTPVEKLWGVGRQYCKLLRKNNIVTAFDYTAANDQWIRKKMSVIGLRIKQELLGVSCMPIELVIPDKKAIATTRAFGRKIYNYNYLQEAVATYATRCAEKLRKQKSVANIITVFIHTDPFNPNEKQYNASKTLCMQNASNNNSVLIFYALRALQLVYKKEFRYKKAGVIVDGLSPANEKQIALNEQNQLKNSKLMDTTDHINQAYGRDTIKTAIMGTGHEWKLRQENLSARYTSRWDEILSIEG